MLTEKRQIEILSIINSKGSLSIAELTETFKISNMTAWRDLKALEEKGLIKKVHGGAIKIDFIQNEPSFKEKSTHATVEKDLIARFVARYLVKDSDIVFLGAGSTIAKIIPHLTQKNLTLLTNGLKTMMMAVKNDLNLNLIGCGGLIRKPALIFTGPEAENFFKRHRANIVFLSGTGLTIEEGIMDPDPLDAEVKKVMCENSDKIVFLMDSTKLNKRSLVSTISLDKIDLLVTDYNAPSDFIQKLEENDINYKVVLRIE